MIRRLCFLLSLLALCSLPAGCAGCGSVPVTMPDAADGAVTDATDAHADSPASDARDGGTDGTSACGPREVTLPADPAMGRWDDSFFLPGMRDDYATIVHDLATDPAGRVYVAGTFSFAGRSLVNGMAMWDPARGWSSMGEVSQGGATSALATAPDGTLYAASNPGMLPTLLRRWDGTRWSLVAEIQGSVYAMRFARDGRLFVAGEYSSIGGAAIPNFAVWNGTSWSSLDGAPDGPATALLVDDESVCIAGAFATIGTNAAEGLACHEGGRWIARTLRFDPNYPFVVSTIARDADRSLLVGGIFVLPGRAPTEGGSLVRWRGDRWELVGGGLVYPSRVDPTDPGWIGGVAVVPEGLLVGGTFRSAGGTEGTAVENLALWDGTRWRDVGGATWGGGAGLVVGAIIPASSGRDVLLAGPFISLGGTSSPTVGRWDGTRFSALEEPGRRALGITGSVAAIAGRGTCGTYVGGGFRYAGGVRVNNIARYDATGAWTPLGDGFPVPVLSLDVAADGTVYASASSLSGSDTVAQVNLLRAFRDGQWSDVGGGLDGAVWTLTVGADGLLYVGGRFGDANGTRVSNMAAWDGSAWHDLGGGVDGLVLDLVAHPDGGVVAVGQFANAGGVRVRGVARWDGRAWSGYGDGLGGELLSVGLLDGRPVVGGHRNQGEGVILVRWDGSAWQEIGAALMTTEDSTQVSDLAVVGGRVFAVGQWNNPSGTTGGVAVFDERGWTLIGGGASMYATRLLVDSSGLFVGGYFSAVGGGVDGTRREPPIVSSGFAHYRY